MDYIPRDPHKLNAYQSLHRQLYGEKCTSQDGKPPEWDHIPDADRTWFGEECDMYEAAYKRRFSPKCTQKDIDDYEVAHERMRKALREMANSYLHHRRVKPEQRKQFEVPAHDTVPTAIPPPEHAPWYKGIRHIAAGIFRIWGILVAANIVGVDKRTLFHVKVYIGVLDGNNPFWRITEAVTDPRFLREYGVVRGQSMKVDMTGESGKTVYIALRYENEKGEVGPWSKVFTVIVT